MKKLVSLLIVVCIFVLCVMPVGAQTGSVSFGIRFDKQSYGIGDTVLATVYVTGLTDSITLGGLGTNLSFSSDDMIYESGEFASAITDATEEIGVGCETQGEKEVIYLFFVDAVGLAASSIYNTSTQTYDLATLSFRVQNPSDGTLTLGFEETSISGSLPFKTDIFDSNYNNFSYSFCAPVIAGIEDFAFNTGTAVQEDGIITVAPFVCTSTPVTVIAKLHTVDSGELITAPVFKIADAVGRNEMNVSFNYAGNLENVRITYYFWGVGAGLMNPQFAPVTIPVNAQ